MNYTICTVVIGSCALSAFSGPLDRASVPADAKWVLHLDAEAFRAASIGKYLTDKVIQPKFEKALAAKNLQLGLSPQNISAVTIYGAKLGDQDKEGTILIKTTTDLEKDLQSLTKLAEQEGKKVEITQEPFPIYSLPEDLYVAPAGDGWLVVSKRKSNVELGRAALLAKIETLAQTKTYTDYPEAPGAFFFVGMAEGFQHENIPAQAQVLKETTGGRIALGEKGDQLFLNLVLKGKTAEAAQKIQQVAQGIVALIQLSGDKPELAELAKSAQFSTEGSQVVLNLNVPVKRALDEIAKHEENRP